MGEIRCFRGGRVGGYTLFDGYNEEGRDKGKDGHPVDRLANSLHQT